MVVSTVPVLITWSSVCDPSALHRFQVCGHMSLTVPPPSSTSVSMVAPFVLLLQPYQILYMVVL